MRPPEGLVQPAAGARPAGTRCRAAPVGPVDRHGNDARRLEVGEPLLERRIGIPHEVAADVAAVAGPAPAGPGRWPAGRSPRRGAPRAARRRAGSALPRSHSFCVARPARGQDAPHRQEGEHALDVAAVRPARRGPRPHGPVLDVAASQRAALAQLREHVLAKGRVLLDPGAHPRVRGRPHLQPVQRVVVGQHERGLVGPVLEQPVLVVGQAVEQRGVERAEPAPQQQQLVPGHDVGRVDLQAGDPLDHLKDPGGGRLRARAREQLAAEREPARHRQRQLHQHGELTSPCTRARCRPRAPSGGRPWR